MKSSEREVTYLTGCHDTADFPHNGLITAQISTPLKHKTNVISEEVPLVSSPL